MKRFLPLALVVVAMGLGGCKKTLSQKVEDKVEDAGHEVSQAGERAGESVKDATN